MLDRVTYAMEDKKLSLDIKQIEQEFHFLHTGDFVAICLFKISVFDWRNKQKRKYNTVHKASHKVDIFPLCLHLHKQGHCFV